MNFSDLINKRRACHHFVPGVEIPDEHFKKMIEETSLTPSGYNAQPWEFVIVKKQENIVKIHEIAFHQPHVKDASAMVVVLGDMEIGRNVEQTIQDWIKNGYLKAEDEQAFRNSMAKNRKPEKKREMAIRNAMLAAMTFIYSAENIGYATCPMMGFSQWKLEEFLEIPEDRCIALLIAIGKADEDKQKPRLPRKTAEEMMHFEKFST
ncbi:MAG: nitroreductase family protein [Candidatus Gracilibacteria bacterium]|nr:nitroreductase family protein [Candidatus Gracilibacteria bacterium]